MSNFDPEDYFSIYGGYGYYVHVGFTMCIRTSIGVTMYRLENYFGYFGYVGNTFQPIIWQCDCVHVFYHVHRIDHFCDDVST